MPKNMPNEMPKEYDWELMYELLTTSESPEKEVKPFASELQKNLGTKDFYAYISRVFDELYKNNYDMLANYIKELYGYGIGKRYFDTKEIKRSKSEATGDSLVETVNELAERVNIDAIESYCLTQCVNYGEIKPVYDMLLELLYGVTDQRWLEAKKRIHNRMMEIEKKTTILNKGAELVMEKKVEFEVNHVEAGGTGVNITKTGRQ